MTALDPQNDFKEDEHSGPRRSKPLGHLQFEFLVFSLCLRAEVISYQVQNFLGKVPLEPLESEILFFFHSVSEKTHPKLYMNYAIFL